MNQNILLVPDKHLYFYPYEETCLYPFKNNRNSFEKIVFKICKKYKLLFPKNILNPLIFTSGGRIIVLDSIFSMSLYRTLCGAVGYDNVVLYFANIISPVNLKMLDIHHLHTYSFDKNDAYKNNIQYCPFPYSSKIVEKEENTTIDALFLGRNKGRDEQLYSLYKYLRNHNLYPCFWVMDSKYDEMRLDQYMPYDQYIDFVMKSKCLVDFLQDEQSGVSLRYKESLFLHKKLITNNVHIFDDPYYDCNNMYVLGYDQRNLESFISSPYINNNIDLSKLDYCTWINQF